jgi:hypothetical protein
MQARVADLLADAMLVMDEAMAVCEIERSAPLEGRSSRGADTQCSRSSESSDENDI